MVEFQSWKQIEEEKEIMEAIKKSKNYNESSNVLIETA